MSKVFAFTGLDMAYGGLDVLRRAIKDDCRILPLDTEAIGFAEREGVGYTTIDEWLGDDRQEAYRRAHEAEMQWFEGGRGDFTSSGVCWPDFDRHAMHYFWQEVFLSKAIAEKCRRAGVRELRYRKVRPRKACVDYEPARVYGSYWGSAWPAISQECNLSAGKQLRWQGARAVRLVGASLARFGLRKKKSEGDRETPAVDCALPTDKGLVVFAVNWAELDRFREVICQVGRDFPHRVAVCLLTDSPYYAAKFNGPFPVPVHPAPTPASPSTESGQKFVQGLDMAVVAAKGAPWEQPLACLGYHFEYYCRERWPHLEAQYQAWLKLWEETRPSVVIVSNLMDAASQLPARAARELGIASASIPHAAGMVRAWDAISAEKVLYDLKVQRSVYLRSGIPEGRLAPCRNLITQDEYRAEDRGWDTESGKLRVLALTDPIAPNGCVAGWVGHAAQIQSLRALAACPKDLASRLDIRFKAHPGWPDTELFDAAGIDARVVFPAATRLESVLARADLVIAVNYCGGALVHAVRCGKPVVLFWREPLLRERNGFWHPDVYAACGSMAGSAEELWRLVSSFAEEPEVAIRLRMQAEAFRREVLDDSTPSSLSDIVKRLLLEGRVADDCHATCHGARGGNCGAS